MGLLDRPARRSKDDGVVSLRGADATGDARVPVVGESHYQRELHEVAGPKRPGGVKLDVQAVLIPEPENEFDPNAVAVYVNGAGKVGYLSREDAVRYQPMVRAYASKGCAAACEAVVLGGDAARETQFCVWLHIAEPD